jgi:signal transduction histidine kinase
MKHILIFVLLLSISIELSATDSLDSLLEQLKDVKEQNERLEILYEIIDEKLDLIHIDNKEFIEQALDIAEDIDSQPDIARLNDLLGIYWSQLGEAELATDFHLKSIKYNEENENDRELAENYRNLGETFRASLDYDQSVKYLKKSVEFFDKAADTINLAMSLNRLAAVLYEHLPEQERQNSVDYAEKSAELAVMQNDSALLANNYNIIGAAYRSIGKLSQARKYLDESYRIYTEIGNVSGIPVVLSNLVYLEISYGNLEKAVYYTDKCSEFSEKHNLPFFNYFLFDIIAEALADRGDYKRAYYYKALSLDYKTSTFDESKRKSILELEAKYQTEKKEQELAGKQQEQIYQLIISIVTIAFIIGIAVLFYSRHRVLKAKNDYISEQNESLRELNATKDKFFSIIAHDIKNPISSFKNALNAMVGDYEEMEKNERKEFLELMNDSAGNLYELLENLLTWARSQRGNLSFNPSRIEMRSIVEQSVFQLAVQASDKNISLENAVPNGIFAKADANMLNTVVRNLISNSIKFTESGGFVRIKARVRDNHVEMEIEDSGIGMDEKVQKKLFKIDESHTSLGTNNEKGTGLGLIICREFIEKHNGKIWVQSQKGVGSHFYFTLPMANQ